jgi:hypothetical protein
MATTNEPTDFPEQRSRTKGTHCVMEAHKDKVEAIYELREAVEQKVHAEQALTRKDTPDARVALLDASLRVEAKTQDAIEVCIHCGRPHTDDEPHERRARIVEHDDNVIDVDFRPKD